MKRAVILLLVLSILLSAAGCGQQQKPYPIHLYYRTGSVSHSDGLIGYEPLEDHISRSVVDISERYFQGPESEDLSSPFPRGTTFVSARMQDRTLKITVSSQLAELSGMNLTLALSCISMTFTQLAQIDAVEISAEDALLGGQESVLIEDGSILLEDNSLQLAENKLTVYYADSKYRYLIPVVYGTKREELTDQAIYALQLLANDPEQDDLRKTMPSDTDILDLSVEDGLCIVDFSHDFYRNRPQSAASERMTILSIVNTLTQFEEIAEVQFYVEGQSVPLYSNMDLSLRYVRDESAIGPVRPGLNEVDATLYVRRSGDGELAAVPTRIKSAANETDADALISQLLSFEEKNGYTSALPKNTVVRSIHVEGYHCYIDLASSFADALKTEEEEVMAVYALVSSLVSLENVRWVDITIAGQSSGLRYIDLTESMR